MLHRGGFIQCFHALHDRVSWRAGYQLSECLFKWGGWGGERTACCKRGPACCCGWGWRGRCSKHCLPNWRRRGVARERSGRWWHLQHGTHSLRGWWCNLNRTRWNLYGWHNPWYRRPACCGYSQSLCTWSGGGECAGDVLDIYPECWWDRGCRVQCRRGCGQDMHKPSHQWMQ